MEKLKCHDPCHECRETEIFYLFSICTTEEFTRHRIYYHITFKLKALFDIFGNSVTRFLADCEDCVYTYV